MVETNRARRIERPNAITLILSASAQANIVLELLQRFDVNYDGALILAQHGSDQQNSELAGQVNKLSSLDLHRVNGSLTLTRGKLYLIASHLNYEITPADQIKPLSQPSHSNRRLLESLAQSFPSRTRVVVLSTIYSDQLQQVSGKNRAFLNLFTLDALHEMAPAMFRELAARYTLKLGSNVIELHELLRASISRELHRPRFVSNEERSGYEQILSLLKSYKNSDFSQYKEASLINRIEKRMRRLRLSNHEQYADRLRVDRRELDSLHASLFIGMTRFFRDTPAFIELQKQLTAYIERAGTKRLSIWSAGCSSGAEPYSLALICDLLRHTSFPDLHVEICATDTDTQAIAVAKTGCYSRKEIENIPTEYLPPELKLKDGKYDLRGSIETEVRFEQHDLLTPPRGSGVDLIVCRNVFIYFTPAAQESILNTFHQCLRPGGLLMLGRHESVGLERTHFKVLSESAKVYKALQLSPSS